MVEGFPSISPQRRCMDEQLTLALLDGRLSPREQMGVDAHLDVCSECRGLVSLLAKSSLAGPLSRGAPLPEEEPSPAVTLRSGGAAEAGTADVVGAQVSRYFVLRRLGAGAMGAVYAAYDPKLQREVALKQLVPDGRSAERQLEEARAMARVSHPNVLGIYDAFEAGDRVFLAMELANGGSLAKWLMTPRPLSRRLDLFIQAARGLEAIHTAGLLHRDFKPENVLITADGQARVADFGLAIASRKAGTESAGTPRYMAPEVREGRAVDPRSDQFSFGVALGEALGGGDDELSSAPAWLRLVVKRATAREPAERYVDMAALLRALTHGRGTRRRRIVAVAATLTMLTVAGTVSWVRNALISQGRLCSGGERRVATAWNAERRRSIRAAYAGLEPRSLGALLERPIAALDRYAEAWTQTAREACEATSVHGEQSAELLDKRMACLDERLVMLRTAASVLEHGDRAVLGKAADLTAQLAPVADCSDLTSLNRRRPEPMNPETRAKLAALRERLAAFDVSFNSGRYDRESPPVAPLVEEARRLGYKPVLAQALFQQLRYELSVRGKGDAATSARDAIDTAEASGEDALAALASVRLARLRARDSDFAEANRVLNHAELLTERAGHSLPLSIELDAAWADIRHVEGRHAEARIKAEKGLRSLGAVSSSNPRDGINLHTTLAQLELNDRRLLQAIKHGERALKLAEEFYTPNHPTVAYACDALGPALAEAGRYVEAGQVLTRSLKIKRDFYEPGSGAIAIALSYLAHLRALERRDDEALALLDEEWAIWRGLEGRAVHRGVNARNRAEILLRMGELSRAAEAIDEALEHMEALPGGHPNRMSALIVRASIELAQKRCLRALATVSRALAAASSSDQPQLVALHVRRAEAELCLGRTTSAGASAREALALPAVSEEPSERARASYVVARADFSAGREPAAALRRAAAAALVLRARVIEPPRRFVSGSRRCVSAWMDKRKIRSRPRGNDARSRRAGCVSSQRAR